MGNYGTIGEKDCRGLSNSSCWVYKQRLFENEFKTPGTNGRRRIPWRTRSSTSTTN